MKARRRRAPRRAGGRRRTRRPLRRSGAGNRRPDCARRRDVRRQRMPTLQGDPAHRSHRRRRELVALRPPRDREALDELLRRFPAHHLEPPRADLPARHPETERRDDEEGRLQGDRAAQLSGHELRVVLGPPQHPGVVGEVVDVRDQRDLDGIPVRLRRPEEPDEPELDLGRGPGRDGRVERVPFERVGGRVAVCERRARRGQRGHGREEGDRAERRSKSALHAGSGEERGRLPAPPLGGGACRVAPSRRPPPARSRAARPRTRRCGCGRWAPRAGRTGTARRASRA